MEGGYRDTYPPWNFSWVIEGKLAAMAWPQTEANLRYIVNVGIRQLVCLSPEKRPPVKLYPQLAITEIPIKEFEAPTLEQILKFINVCERCEIENQAVGVHCRMGRGRTGVMAACYLVRFYDQTPECAITNIRLMRPGSIETSTQTRSVKRYHDCLRGLNPVEV